MGSTSCARFIVVCHKSSGRNHHNVIYYYDSFQFGVLAIFTNIVFKSSQPSASLSSVVPINSLIIIVIIMIMILIIVIFLSPFSSSSSSSHHQHQNHHHHHYHQLHHHHHNRCHHHHPYHRKHAKPVVLITCLAHQPETVNVPSLHSIVLVVRLGWGGGGQGWVLGCCW